MNTTVETLEDNKVKLSIEVDDSEFETAVDEAFRALASEVRIPGFRPGKAPRKVLEARLGSGVAREEALRQALPDYYEQAVREHEIDVIAPPDIDITDGHEDGPVAFDAVVEIRPTIVVAGYENLRVEIPSPAATDEEIAEQIDHLRGQHGELETVDRAAIDGDHVSIDIAGTQDGEELSGLTAEDYLYEVGSGAVVAEIDEQLRGAKPGDILEFDAAHPDEDQDESLEFRILVKEVKAKNLPALDDAFAAEASEFDTVDELRADLGQRLAESKKARAAAALQEKTAEALSGLVVDDPPEAMVSNEMQQRLQDLALRLGAQGVTLEQYLQATGGSQEQITGDLREAAVPAVKVDLALRAVADAQEIEVTDDDVDAELAKVAEQMGQDIDSVRDEFQQHGQLPAVRSDVRKREALEWLLDAVEIVDEAGEPVERASLEPADTTETNDTDGDDTE